MAITQFTGPVFCGPQQFADGSTDPFGGINTGKVALSQTANIVFNAANAGTNAYFVANLPNNSQIIDMHIDISTAFAGSTATGVTLGVFGTATKFTNSVNIQAGATRFVLTPTTPAQALAWNDVLSGANNPPLYMVVTQTGGTPTAGHAFLVINYIQWPETGTTN
jgi:hypothetical protein